MNNNLLKASLVFIFIVIVSGLGIRFYLTKLNPIEEKPADAQIKTPSDPLMIEVMRKTQYPGSQIIIEQTLTPGSNYRQYIVSYLSDGLKIYALMTVPEKQAKPKNGWPASNALHSNAGWPVIIFNHGYIPPTQYRTTERYIAYVDALARSGYIILKPDYRGNGNSQGQPDGAYYSPAYATDVLNALFSIKKYPEADPNKIGMWGHSMGGNIVLRDIVVDTKDIKAAVIWGGVVGSYNDLINNWQRRVTYQPPPNELALRNRHRTSLTKEHGTPADNPTFWQSIDPTYFLKEITTPIQLHTGGSDEEVPVAFSQSLEEKLKSAGKTVEYYDYPGGDHNISSPNFELAMQRTIQFFDKYLK
ncbi:MAG: alpha/beta fold hydrolase [Candidatus Gottesmanbacteria bacterium]